MSEIKPTIDHLSDSYVLQILMALAKRDDEIERLTAEVSKYKPFFDAVDNVAIVTWTLDSKLSPNEQLAAIIDWHIQVATDPAVNGGFELVPVSGRESPK